MLTHATLAVFHNSSLEASFAFEVMVSASLAFIVGGETDSVRGREGLGGCPKASSSAIMIPSLFH